MENSNKAETVILTASYWSMGSCWEQKDKKWCLHFFLPYNLCSYKKEQHCTQRVKTCHLAASEPYAFIQLDPLRRCTVCQPKPVINWIWGVKPGWLCSVSFTASRPFAKSLYADFSPRQSWMKSWVQIKILSQKSYLKEKTLFSYNEIHALASHDSLKNKWIFR